MKTYHFIAAAQVILSTVFLVGYFYMLYLFVTGSVNTPLAWKDTLAALISVLTAGVITILAFWFNRGRHGMDVDTEYSLGRIRDTTYRINSACPNCGSSLTPSIPVRAGSVREGV
jgi:hypothetical protein